MHKVLLSLRFEVTCTFLNIHISLMHVQCTHKHLNTQNFSSYLVSECIKTIEQRITLILCIWCLALVVFLHTDINECKRLPNGECDHICMNTNGNYYCSCHDGYVLGNDSSSCIGMCIYLCVANSYCCDSDINECQTDNGGCTQRCNNTDGSYQCYCWDGYELSDDDHNCIGEH